MTTLASAVSIGDTHIHIDTAFDDGSFPGFVKIGTEMLSVGGADNLTHKTLALSEPASAAHNNGSTVTYAGRPFDSDFLAATAGGGAAEEGTVVEQLTGAQTTYGHFYRGDEDPAVDFSGELEPGDLWVQTGGDPPFINMVRNAANDDWIPVPSLAMVLGNGNDTDGSPLVVSAPDVGDPASADIALTTTDADTNADLTLLSNTTGNASAKTTVTADAGDADVSLTAIAANPGGVATAGALAKSGTFGAGITSTAENGVGVLQIHDGILENTSTGAAGEVLEAQGDGDARWAYHTGNAVADLVLTVSDPPTQVEMQSVADKVDQLLAELRTAKAIET